MGLIGLILLIALLIIIGSLLSMSDSSNAGRRQNDASTDLDPLDAHEERSMKSIPYHQKFTVTFPNNRHSDAVLVPQNSDPQRVLDIFGLESPRPTIFLTGGASKMSEDDIARTREVMEVGIAEFAQKHNVTIVDGGTEAGVMQMLGEVRKQRGFTFPLIGTAPLHKVSFPGYQPSEPEAELEDGHSHFVLVDSHNWGDESNMIIGLTRAISAQTQPKIGVLINGGKISEREAYLATSEGNQEDRIQILVLDGSGRTASDISTAFKTGHTDSWMIRAIIKNDLIIAELSKGPQDMLDKLQAYFQFEAK